MSISVKYYKWIITFYLNISNHYMFSETGNNKRISKFKQSTAIWFSEYNLMFLPHEILYVYPQPGSTCRIRSFPCFLRYSRCSILVSGPISWCIQWEEVSTMAQRWHLSLIWVDHLMFRFPLGGLQRLSVKLWMLSVNQ